MLSRRRITAALVSLIVLAVGGWLVSDLGAESGGVPGAESGLKIVGLSTLPAEAVETLDLIESGGPFPHEPNDGSIFGNREGILPDREQGYYHEYTVPTPGAPDRGARRFVTGAADELYYTEDHYQSFVVVDVSE